MLEARSKGKTTDALKSLMRLAPKTATIVVNGAEQEVLIEQVKKGDIFVVRPGENIPVDGVVVEGSSAVNEAALTGESIPVDKMSGDMVSAATLNQSGFLKCEATRVGEDNTHIKEDSKDTKIKMTEGESTIFFAFCLYTFALFLGQFWLWNLHQHKYDESKGKHTQSNHQGRSSIRYLCFCCIGNQTTHNNSHQYSCQ